MAIKTPLNWIGGKNKMWYHIVPVLTAYQHRVYVEPFGGGAAVLLAKPRVMVETYNDLDQNLYEFFSVLTDPILYPRLLDVLSRMPYSRDFRNDYLDEWRAGWKNEPDMVRRVAKWYAINKQGVSGGMGSKGLGYTVAPRRAVTADFWPRATSTALETVIARLRTVQIENQCFRKILTKYDHPETLFYCDPPYVAETRAAPVSVSYRHEMSLDDHMDMVRLLIDLDRVAVVSGYKHEVYEELSQAGYILREFNMACTSDSRARHKQTTNEPRPRRTECLWIHPKVAKCNQPQLFKLSGV